MDEPLGLDLDGDNLREECGVFGILGHPEAATLTALGLHALQHRGQEAAGIAVSDGQTARLHKDVGLVTDRQDGTRRLYSVDPDGLAVLRAHLDGFWERSLAAFQQHANQDRERPDPDRDN